MEQCEDPFIQCMITECQALEATQADEAEMPNGHRLCEAIQCFRLHDDLLYHVEYSTEDNPECPARLVVVVPESRVNSILQFVHESYGHARGTSQRDTEGIGQCVYIDHGHVSDDELNSNSTYLIFVDQASGFVAAVLVPDWHANSVIAVLHSHWV
ncbi:hypothetical protein LPJ61_002089 [Coemansia biformis]|uniref:Uncharacterized protein n=1 Tax=Coemansia biformis TaxID=1286918 RepID=A0A9W7Y8Y1_9FUNG|nr:hypothetical protein LPJ61_002089 [Coemansia biformis]